MHTLYALALLSDVLRVIGTTCSNVRGNCRRGAVVEDAVLSEPLPKRTKK